MPQARGGKGTQPVTLLAEPLAPPVAAGDVTIEEPPRPRYVRRPEDLLRLVVALVLVVLGTAVAILFQDAVVTFENDVFAAIGGVSAHTRHDIAGHMRDAADWIGDIALVVLLVRRRFRLAGYLILASFIGHVAASSATSILRDIEPGSFSQVANKTVVGKWVWDDPGSVGIAATMVTVLVCTTGPKWRKVWWTALGLVVVARIFSSSVLPATAFFELALGLALGSAILFVFKAPNPRPTGQDVAGALGDAGFPLRSLR